MRFITPNLDVEVSMKKSGNKLVVPKPQISQKTIDPETGEWIPVEKIRVVDDSNFLWKNKGTELASESKLIDPDSEQQVPTSEALQVLLHYKYKTVDNKGREPKTGEDLLKLGLLKEIPEGIDLKKPFVVDFAAQEDGSFKEVRPFSKTAEINVPEPNWVPSIVLDDFGRIETYELFSDKYVDEVKLVEECEKRLSKDQVGITTFSHGGYVQYYGFVIPHLVEGKYVWVLKLSDTQVELKHLRDIPTKVKLPVKKRPEIPTLPPVPALVMAVAAKKKKKN